MGCPSNTPRTAHSLNTNGLITRSTVGGNILPNRCLLVEDKTGWLHVLHEDGFYAQSLLDNPYPKKRAYRGSGTVGV
jgi:hypothetical protein